jgi:hypothetical protein
MILLRNQLKRLTPPRCANSFRGLAFANTPLDFKGKDCVLRATDKEMESITTDHQDINPALTEPHFDEEATVLSARPVVPLKEIKRENSKKWLAFGAAMLLSLIVGALGASLIFKQRAQKPVMVEAPGVEGALEAFDKSATPAEKPLADAGTGEVPDTNPTTIPKVKPASVIPKSISRVPPRVAAPARANERVTIANRDDEREFRRAERIERRRLTRRAEWEEIREGRRRRKGSDDLLRIRDIFEGPRRRY